MGSISLAAEDERFPVNVYSLRQAGLQVYGTYSPHRCYPVTEGYMGESDGRECTAPQRVQGSGARPGASGPEDQEPGATMAQSGATKTTLYQSSSSRPQFVTPAGIES